MYISYKKLWKLLIDKDIKKKDLILAAKISSSTLAKLTRGKNVNTNILLRICNTLHCDISEIMEIVDNK
jgi:DNA-binding Xre family transcriptional regulator